MNSSRTIDDVRFRHLVTALHALGPRPLYELLREVEAGADLHERLEVYARLPIVFLRANDGDKLPQTAFAIRGGRRDV